MENNCLLRKRRIIKRICIHSAIYSEEDLYKLTLQQLIFIQRDTLIELTIKIKYNKRHERDNK
jgi:hypothetical protein